MAKKREKCRHYFVPDLVRGKAVCIYCGKEIDISEMIAYIYGIGEEKEK